MSKTERKFSILFDKISIPVALSSLPDGALVDVNEAWINTFGFSREEAIGRTTFDLDIHTNSEERAQIHAEVEEKGFAHDRELHLRTRAGATCIFLTNVDIVEMAGQKYILHTTQDITERKHVEQQLERNYKKLNEILDSIQDDFYVLDRDWKFVYASRLFTSKIGKEPKDFVGNNIWEMFPKHVGTIFEENLRAAMEKRETRRFEIPGKYTNAWYRMRAFPSEEGITLLGTDITERKRAEEQLHYQATLLSHVNDAVMASDAEFRVTAWNTAAESLYGWKADEVMGRNGLEILRTEWVGRDADEMRRIIAETGQWRGEATQQRKDGTRFPVEVSSIVLYDDARCITGYVSVNRDITERKKNEEALRLNSIMMENMPAGVYLVRASDAVIVYTNSTFDRLFGYEPGEVIGKHVSVLNAPGEHSPRDATELIIKSLEQNGIWQGEVYSLRKDGTPFWASANIKAFEHTTHGRVWVAARQDITERKQAEEALIARMDEIETLLNVSPIAIYVAHDPQCTRITGNPVAYQLLEMPETSDANVSKSAPLHERPTYRVFRDGVELPPEELPMQKAARLGVDINEEALELRFFNGTRKFLYAFAKPLFDSNGKSRGAVAAMIDITARKEVEEQLRELSQRLTYHVDNSPLAVIEWGPDMSLIRWSKEAEHIFGWTAEEVLGKRIEDFKWVFDEDVQSVKEVSVELRTGSDPRRFSANRNYRKDGSVAYCEWYNSSLMGDEGNLRSILSLVLDVTERVKAEAALRENEKQLQALNETLEQKVHEKTAEVRHLASTLIRAEQRERHRISHILHDDLQQRIYVTQMQLTFLRDDLAPTHEKLSKQVENLEKQIDDILKITRHLSIDLSPPILPGEGLSHAVEWLAAQMHKRYGIQIDLQAEGSFTIPDEELHVLLFNCIRELLFNIVKHAEASRATVTLQWLNKDLCIEVSDNGKGFPSNKAGQEPVEGDFEEDGLPTSFGLPTIRYQLSLFNGRMEIQSEAGKGTRIVLIIPVTVSV